MECEPSRRRNRGASASCKHCSCGDVTGRHRFVRAPDLRVRARAEAPFATRLDRLGRRVHELRLRARLLRCRHLLPSRPYERRHRRPRPIAREVVVGDPRAGTVSAKPTAPVSACSGSGITARRARLAIFEGGRPIRFILVQRAARSMPCCFEPRPESRCGAELRRTTAVTGRDGTKDARHLHREPRRDRGGALDHRRHGGRNAPPRRSEARRGRQRSARRHRRGRPPLLHRR